MRGSLRAILLACGGAPAAAQQFVNGDFNTGSLTGWTIVNTANGVGTPGSVTTIDIDGPGPLGTSPAARFSAGQVAPIPAAQEGVLMTQSLTLTAGVAYEVRVDWTARNGLVGSASDCGLFAVMVDGVPIASATAGALLGQTSAHGHLAASFSPPTSGIHNVGLRITRPFVSVPLITQHVDNVELAIVSSACYPNCDGSTASPLLSPNDFQCFLTRFASGDAYANCDGSTAPSALTPNDFQCFLTRFVSGNSYANCDGSTVAPVLTPNDFQCFLDRYAAGHPYANCDGSPAPSVLTPNDFQCFLTRFAGGCS